MTDRSVPARRVPIPMLDLVLGYGPALLLPLLALFAFLLPADRAGLPVAIAQLWGAAILIFLAGVRRGLSFTTPGGARVIQIVTMLWLFVLGLLATALPPVFAFPILIVGYASIALLDPPAARRGEAPAHFARLRPPQMGVALVGLITLAIRVHLG